MRCDDCGTKIHNEGGAHSLYTAGAVLCLCATCYSLRLRLRPQPVHDPRTSYGGQDPRAGLPPRATGRPF